jgi:hypothetical protein
MTFAADERAVDPPVEQTGQDYFSSHAGPSARRSVLERRHRPSRVGGAAVFAERN